MDRLYLCRPCHQEWARILHHTSKWNSPRDWSTDHERILFRPDTHLYLYREDHAHSIYLKKDISVGYIYKCPFIYQKVAVLNTYHCIKANQKRASYQHIGHFSLQTHLDKENTWKSPECYSRDRTDTLSHPDIHRNLHRHKQKWTDRFKIIYELMISIQPVESLHVPAVKFW